MSISPNPYSDIAYEWQEFRGTIQPRFADVVTTSMLKGELNEPKPPYGYGVPCKVSDYKEWFIGADQEDWPTYLISRLLEMPICALLQGEEDNAKQASYFEKRWLYMQNAMIWRKKRGLK